MLHKWQTLFPPFSSSHYYIRFNQLEGLCGGDLAFENNFQLECLLLSHNKMEDFPAEVMVMVIRNSL